MWLVIQIGKYLPQHLRETTVMCMPQGTGNDTVTYTIKQSHSQHLPFTELWLSVALTAIWQGQYYCPHWQKKRQVQRDWGTWWRSTAIAWRTQSLMVILQDSNSGLFGIYLWWVPHTSSQSCRTILWFVPQMTQKVAIYKCSRQGQRV